MKQQTYDLNKKTQKKIPKGVLISFGHQIKISAFLSVL